MSGKGIVLLVEDNLKILNLNRRILEKDGLMVLAAKTIAEAREYVKLAVPDLVVLDIMMPDGSGLDFLSEFREQCKAPVLFLTAKTEHEDILDGLRAGGNDYIAKPYDIAEFRMRVLGFLSLVDSVKKHRRQDNVPSPSSVLTERELSVAMFAAQGLLNKEIAAKVFLSESRVKTSLSGIYSKLEISDKANKRDLLAEILDK
ncbi:MAG: response regulator [Treponema sp.]|jgi:DNA-binding NarL/FixJ family response regulator|nr:response regulator [Treponema sp.]